MSGLRDAIAQQQQGLGELARSRADSAAWSDDQRQSLDRNCLEPLAQDGQRLLDALRKASHEIVAAQQMVTR